MNNTSTIRAEAMRKGGYIILNGDKPCRILEVFTAKTGKHGHVKYIVTGVDIFDGTKYEDTVIYMGIFFTNFVDA